MTPEQVNGVLRAGAVRAGYDPAWVSTHSLRAGGATALYQVSGNIDLAKRLCRWRSEAISAYLWEPHSALESLAGKMSAGGQELHAQARQG